MISLAHRNKSSLQVVSWSSRCALEVLLFKRFTSCAGQDESDAIRGRREVERRWLEGAGGRISRVVVPLYVEVYRDAPQALGNWRRCGGTVDAIDKGPPR
jgi:hypothetical protein